MREFDYAINMKWTMVRLRPSRGATMDIRLTSLDVGWAFSASISPDQS
jgi:hypothetical protein